MTLSIEATIEAAIKAAGVPITGMRFPSITNKATWTVDPPSLQSAAQPIIDAFNPADPASLRAAADAEVDADDKLSDLLDAIVEAWSDVSTLVAAGKKAQASTRIKAALRNLRRARKGV